MPQPLSSYLKSKGDYSLNFGDKAIESEPELATLFARILVAHSMIEASIGMLLVKILHAHARPGYAMFNALTSTAAKSDVLTAVAQENALRRRIVRLRGYPPNCESCDGRTK